MNKMMTQQVNQQMNESDLEMIFDVISSETDASGKTRWQVVGVAFPLKNGAKGFSMRLHMFPQWFVVKETLRPVGANQKAKNIAADANEGEAPPF